MAKSKNGSGDLFWPDRPDDKDLSNCLLNELDFLLAGKPDKLIAQCYDGAAVMSGHLNGVQKIIKSKYNNAHYIHCYAHQINLSIQNSQLLLQVSKKAECVGRNC